MAVINAYGMKDSDGNTVKFRDDSGGGGGGASTADAVSYSNTTSGLSSTNVQDAIDDIDAEVDDIVNVYGSKNLLPNKAISQTINGVTFTVNADGSVSTSGTSGSGATWLLCTMLYDWTNSLQAGVIYKANGCPIGADSSINICLWNEAEWVRVFAGQDVSFTKPSSIHRNVRLAIGTDSSNVNFDGLTFYPMVRLASITDSTYEPYSMTNQQITKRLSGQSNRNLMDNAWFTVNQRGSSDYNWTAAEQSDPSVSIDRMILDRWHMMDSAKKETVHLHASGGITITNNRTDDNSWFVQVAPPEVYSKYAGKTVTISVDVVSRTGSGIIWLYCHGSAFVIEKTGINAFTLTLPSTISNANACHIVLSPNTSIRIRAVKLELGSVSTLAYDVAPDYDEELAKCQRYFIHDVGKCCAGYSFGNVLRAKIPTSIKMRANPTVIVNTSGYAVGNSTGITTLGDASSVTAISENDGIRLEYGGLTVNDGTYVLDATVSLSFSAEL